MGQRTIDTVLKLSGESEYKSALKSCASELKLLKSDLDATTSEFRNNANSMEALTAKGEILGQMYAKQQEKVSLLAGALENAKKHRDAEEQQVADLKAQYEQAKKALAEYGDEVDKNSQEYQEAQKNVDQLRDAVIKHQAMLDASTASVEKYSTQLNRAHIELDKLDDKVEENRKLLNEARDSADSCATSIDRYGKQVKNAAEALDDASEDAREFDDALSDIGTDDISFGDILGADMIADAAGSIIESLGEVAEETKEYRKIMASLEESGKAAGYSAEETSDAYLKLFGVLADEQAAATTLANLQALGVSQDELLTLIDGTIGGWAKYGDSIPIDGLAEAINHTAKLGEVQGVFADILEWNGISADEFNERLASVSSEEERLQIITGELARQDLPAMGEAWQKNNASMVASNEASANLQAQLARLGETVEPIFTGLTGLAADFLGVINDGLDQMAQKTAAQDLGSSMDGFATAMSTAAAATATTTAEVETSANMAKTYLDRLKELESGGLETAEAQQEYAQTVELLNGLIPDLNLSIDETTGLLDQDTGSILENIQAWKDRATAQALQKQLTAEIEAQADANAALYTAEQKKIELEAKEKEILRQLAEAQSKTGDAADDTAGYMNALAGAMAQGMDVAGGLTGDLGALGNASLGVSQEQAALEDELARVRSEMSDLDGEIENANGLIAESEERISETTDAYDRYSEAVGDASENSEENAESVDLATDAYSDLADQSEETADAVSDGAEDMSSAVTDATQEIITAYNDAKVSARESIDNQIGLFDDLSGKCELSTRDMIDNLKSQQKAFENYADNITLAMERGIDIGLVQKLSDGSVESMQLLAQLVTATDEEIAELNAAFAGVENAKTYLSEGMAEVSKEFLDYLVELGKLTEQEAYELGQQLVNGWINGANSKKKEYCEAVGEIARVGNSEYKRVNLINSPSKRYEQYAEYDVDGLITGYKKSKPRFEKASAELANAGYVSMIRAKQLGVPSMVSSAVSTPSGGDSRLYGLLQQLLAAVREGKILALDGKTWVGSTANAYDAKFGQMKILTDRGAT